MPFKVFKRKDSVKRDDLPKISIRGNSFAFNAEFSRKANLDEFSRVTISIDDVKRKIGFKFHNNKN